MPLQRAGVHSLFLAEPFFCRHDAKDAKIAPDFLGLSNARLDAAIERLQRLIEFRRSARCRPGTWVTK
jgi:hypothetical protein